MQKGNFILRFFRLFLKKRYWFFILLFLIPVWIFFISPFLLKIPNDFKYKADMISVDNFYDEKNDDFSNEQYSQTHFSYEALDSSGPIITIKNVFHVQDSTGKTIFRTAPLYGINSLTGQHVPGAGDRDRDGYLFAPKWLQETDTFSYWHVSNNSSFHMQYVGERFFYGLRLLKYESQYEGPLDQTELMYHLPGVPEKRGVKLGNRISLWIEPVSGYLVKLEEYSEEYFYFDIKTGQKIAPYNQFLNVYTDESFLEHIKKAQKAKQKVIIVQVIVPVVMALILVLLLLFYRFPDLLLFSRKYAIPLVFFIGGIGMTFFAFTLAQRNIEINETQNFSLQAKDITRLINEKMNIYNNILTGGKGFFDASDSVERNEWGLYVNSLNIEKSHPGIQGLGFAKAISPAEKDAFVASVHAEGFPDFTLTPEGIRDTYTSILFLEPFNERNKRAFGYDMFSDSVRREAMIQARDSGKPALSHSVILKQETDENVQKGFLLFVPVYKKGNDISTLAQRIQNIYGYVYSPFRINDFIEGIIDIQKYDVTFQIFDGLRANADSRIYLSHDALVGTEQKKITFGSRETLSIADRPWTIVFNNSPTFERSQIYKRLSYGILILGFCISGLLFLTVYSITNSRNTAVLYAKKINKKLIKNIAQLENTKKELTSTLAAVEVQKDKFSQANIRLNLATKSAKIGVWEWDIVSDKLIWDTQMYTLYGVQSTDFSGAYQAWSSGMYHKDKEKIENDLHACINEKKPFDTKFRVVWPDQSIHDIRAFGVVERDEKGQPLRMVGVNWDITHEAIIERQKTEFVSVASHQLRTPLTAVSWYTEMLLDKDTNKLSPNQKKYLNEIYNSNKIMIELVNKLLNVSRIELDTLPIQSKEIDVVSLARDVIREQQKIIDTKKIVVIQDFKSLPPYTTDPILIRIILQNLIENSLKYTLPGGKISCRIWSQKNILHIEIADTGCGIPQSVHKQIFHKFFRADNIGEVSGTGLGLYIVKSIIEKLHGTISFSSLTAKDKNKKTQKTGTKFSIKLPLKK